MWPTPCASLAANLFPAREKATGLLPRITRSRFPFDTFQIDVSCAMGKASIVPL
jgi:hypothetical protein